MKEMITRSYNFEIRANDNENTNVKTLVGRPIVYDSRTDLGYFDEIIVNGALINSDLSDVRFLVNHDFSKIPLARAVKGNQNSTMRMTIDNTGLLIEVDLDIENNSEAKSLYSAVKRGDITGMSFMFTIDSEEWVDLNTNHPTRKITSIGIVREVSAVTFPAYESTEISTRDRNALEKAKQTLNNTREKKSLELEKLKAKYLFNI